MNGVAVHISCGPNTKYLSQPYYQAALVATVALGIIATALAVTQFYPGSMQFYASVAVSGTGFTLFALLVIRGCISREIVSEEPKGNGTDHELPPQEEQPLRGPTPPPQEEQPPREPTPPPREPTPPPREPTPPPREPTPPPRVVTPVRDEESPPPEISLPASAASILPSLPGDESASAASTSTAAADSSVGTPSPPAQKEPAAPEGSIERLPRTTLPNHTVLSWLSGWLQAAVRGGGEIQKCLSFHLTTELAQQVPLIIGNSQNPLGDAIRKIGVCLREHSADYVKQRENLFKLIDEAWWTQEYQAYLNHEKLFVGDAFFERSVQDKELFFRARYLQQLCMKMFTGVHLHAYADAAVHRAIQAGIAEKLRVVVDQAVAVQDIRAGKTRRELIVREGVTQLSPGNAEVIGTICKEVVAIISASNGHKARLTNELLERVSEQVLANLDGDMPLHKLLDFDREAIEKAPGALKGSFAFKTVNQAAGGYFGDFFPLRRNNFASHLWTGVYTVGSERRTVEFLRFGSPTGQENLDNPAALESAFTCFLDACRRDGKRLVSFQLQNRKVKTGKSDNEQPRIQAMIDLATREYPDVLKVVTFPMNDEFFKLGLGKGAGTPQRPIETTDFIESLLKRMSNSELFHFPEANFIKNHEVEIRALFQQIAESCFGAHAVKAAVLTENRQKRVFQMLAYTAMIEYCTVYFKADYAHAQCKDAMDRAMSLMSLAYYVNLVRQNREGVAEERENMRVLVHHAPLFIKGMGMHGERFAMLIEALEHLEQRVDFDKLRDVKTQVGGVDVFPAEMAIVKAAGQAANPFSIEARAIEGTRVPAQAVDLEEYAALLAAEHDVYRCVEENYIVNENVVDRGEATKIQFRKDLDRGWLYLRDGEKLDPGFTHPTLQGDNVLYADPIQFRREEEKLRGSVQDQVAGIMAEYGQMYFDAWETFLDGQENSGLLMEMMHQGSLAVLTKHIKARYTHQDFEIHVGQREENTGRANACVNVRTEGGKVRFIEVYHVYKINFELSPADIRTHYMQGMVRIDVESGDAEVICSPPGFEEHEYFKSDTLDTAALYLQRSGQSGIGDSSYAVIL